MQPSNMDRHLKVFFEEAEELLEELELALLELEERPDDMETVGQVFRSIHTIKGSSSMFGLNAVSSLAHEVEALFDAVRNGNIRITKALIDLSLAAVDQLGAMVQAIEKGKKAGGKKSEKIMETLRGLMAQPGGEASPAPSSLGSPKKYSHPCPKNRGARLYHIKFSPPENVFLRGLEPLVMFAKLESLGHCSIKIDAKAIPRLEDLDPEHCYASWDVALATRCGPDSIRDVFMFVDEGSELTIEEVDGDATSPGNMEHKKLGEILMHYGEVTEKDLEDALNKQKRVGEIIVESGLADHDTVEAAIEEQRLITEVRERVSEKLHSSTIRVPAERLDTLVDLVGEMVTVEASLRETTSEWDDLDLYTDESETVQVEIGQLHKLIRISRKMERLVADLRDNTMSIRMLPVAVTFSKFRRLVRDLSKNMNKEVEFRTSGGETELDKTVIEQLDAPLVHIIRNCIDHGIEDPSEREAAGKPRQGTVHLSAEHSGAHVFIHIEDDGRGIDSEGVKAKVIEKGLVSADASISDEEALHFLYAPGFSTAKTVTDVSGRGVGMNVVGRTIDGLGGSVYIKSVKGAGTRISLKLPLTLAIIDGLLVDIGGDSFIIPLSTVEECVELTREDVEATHGRDLINIRGHTIPYIPLRRALHMEGSPPDIEQVVITGSNGRRVGFVVDSVVGEYQTMIKNLGSVYKDVKCVSGASILGDGTVALILDVNQISSHAKMAERELFSK